MPGASSSWSLCLGLSVRPCRVAEGGRWEVDGDDKRSSVMLLLALAEQYCSPGGSLSSGMRNSSLLRLRRGLSCEKPEERFVGCTLGASGLLQSPLVAIDAGFFLCRCGSCARRRRLTLGDRLQPSELAGPSKKRSSKALSRQLSQSPPGSTTSSSSPPLNPPPSGETSSSSAAGCCWR